MDGHRTHGWHNPTCCGLSVLMRAVVRLIYTFVVEFGKCRGIVTTAIRTVCIAFSGNVSHIFQFDTNRTSSYTPIRLCTSHHSKLHYFFTSLSSIPPLHTCPPLVGNPRAFYASVSFYFYEMCCSTLIPSLIPLAAWRSLTACLYRCTEIATWVVTKIISKYVKGVLG